MFGPGDLLKAIAQSNPDDRNAYLNAVDQNYLQSNFTSQARSINFLLSAAKSRPIGLRFLDQYIIHCPKNIIEKNAIIWFNVIIKSCNTNEIKLYGELIFEVLGRLLSEIQYLPEISKSFGANYLGKIYDSLSVLGKDTHHSCTIAALQAVQKCLRYYPGSSKSGKNLVSQYLVKLLDCGDREVVYESGNCWMLLQLVRGNQGGTFDEEVEWNNLQVGLVASLHSLLIDAFPNHIREINEIDTSGKLEYFTLTLQGDPIERVASVSTRFCNLIEFLKVALSNPYPAIKKIREVKILNLIQHGLGLSNENYASNQNIDNVCLGNLLPTMHSKLLELLEVLIDICHTHLRIHFRLITTLLLETLKKSKTPDGNLIQSVNLRIQVYKVIIVWLSTLGEGSGYQFIVEGLVKNICDDIMIRSTEIYLTPSKKGGKRSRSEISEPCAQGGGITNKENIALSKQALRCLQAVLVSVGYLLKPVLIKNIYNTVWDINLQILKKRTDIENPYDDWSCRLEIYETIFKYITLRNMPYPSPANLILHMLDDASKTDASSEIRMRCKSMIATIERIIHPQRESLIFKRDAQNCTHIITKSTENGNHDSPINDQLTENGNHDSPIDDQLTIDNNENSNTDTDTEEKDSSADISSDMPDMHISDSESEEPLAKVQKIEENSDSEINPQITAPKGILLNVQEDDSKIKTRLNLLETNLKKKAELNPNDVKISKRGTDDDYIAELQAAFVDEPK